MADGDMPRKFLLSQSRNGLLAWSSQVRMAEVFGWSLADVEAEALAAGLLPARYARNRSTFSIDDQLRFCRARVGVIGCGGIGGHVVEGLARLGVGTIVAIDPDCFDESNLNRQLFATIAMLGKEKVEAAGQRVSAVNPAINVVPCRQRLTRENGATLLEGCAVAVDALDSIAARMELADVCDTLGIPMVHGAIAGWYGQVSVRFPGEATLDHLYGRGDGAGEQTRLGNPSFTPMAAAACEIAEVCKILTGQGRPLRERVLMLDLHEATFDEIGFSSEES
ncbi:ThiF family adenylyltransferase [Telmatospirillum sp.]|uniref:HesA/MoeB/ThiF family protein n=1 Tax=Telmatospirillum sp. TaxID=2079197 RepID=UPI002846B16E|nr:ThiF family adenylyltransferase [Telmatospirillum sp.]MDR3439811.1 ThiF family adenylyltransferase [Telmatospirillum sp.]